MFLGLVRRRRADPHVVGGSGENTLTGAFGASGSALDTADRVIYAALRRALGDAGEWRRKVVRRATPGSSSRMPAWQDATPLAAPADYFEARFHAEAGRAYRIWIPRPRRQRLL